MEQETTLTAAGVARFLAAEHPFSFEVLASTASTNTLARERAKEGAAEGLIVIARQQTAGRGRFERRFHSPMGTGLYMSVVLRPALPPLQIPLLTTAAAVAVAESIEELTDRTAQIKWVNDVLINGKKVCGILTESALSSRTGQAEYAVLGIGVNVMPPNEGFAEEIRDIAGAVFETAEPFARERLAAAILRRFWGYYQALPDRPFLTPYRERSLVLGREVLVRTGEEAGTPARALALDDDGRLLVRYADGSEQWLGSGEVSLRVKA